MQTVVPVAQILIPMPTKKCRKSRFRGDEKFVMFVLPFSFLIRKRVAG
jgi:hypothetical protein